ncbi:MAG: S9 family peptidase [Burkholderiales bacterium]|nr:S9 family peptidase [Burkholderiales bacterium]
MHRKVAQCLIALISLTSLVAPARAGSDDGLLTLEMLYHPLHKTKFEAAPLTHLNWDAQNRLIETQMKDGIVQQWIVDPVTWEKHLLKADDNLSALLTAAGIDADDVQRILKELTPQIKPEVHSYLFSYRKDLWLLDRRHNTVRELTHTPNDTKDEAILSPDARSVAYLKGNDLYVTDVASARERRLTSDGSDTNLNGRLDWVYMEEIYGRGKHRAFWWSPDSKKLAFLNFDESKVPLYTLSGDFALPAKPQSTRYPKAGDPNPVVRLGIVDLKAQTIWTENPYPGSETLIVQVGWAPDGHLLAAWQDRVQSWLDLRLYDQKNAGSQQASRSRVMVRESSPAWTERLPLPVFLKDGGFLWESDRSGHRHIYRYDQAYHLKAALTQGDWDVRHVDGVDELRSRVLFVSNERNPIGNDVYSVQLDGQHRQRLSADSGMHTVRWNTHFTYFLDSWSSLRQPPKQALFNDAGEQVRLIDDAGIPVQLHNLKQAIMKQQQVPTRDGFAMESLLFLPPDFDPKKKYPVVQNVYAGPMAPQVRDRWNANLWYQFLAQHGYVVWILDNRSASDKGVASAWPIHRNLGQLELQDQLDGLAWLRQQGWADMDRIALNGWSYGGYFTSYAMTHSKAWKLGLVGAPVTDWRLYDSVYTERYMGLPQENQRGYEQSSVPLAAKDLSGKILIMHGTMDDNVHPQNSVMLIDALIKSDKDYELQLYPGQGHGVRGDWLTWSLQKARWRFIKDNL